jgi:formate hydrogenlyase subunit 6/NADH:ubiquinone oxidoreductase subunit I
MTIGSMLGNIVGSLFKKPATEHYPFERYKEPERLRGKLEYDPTKCTGCQLCVKDCPADALELITVDKATKKYVMRYHTDRCTFCSQCIESCRFKCLDLPSEKWELSSSNKESFVVLYGRDEDIAIVMARLAQPNESES